MNGPDQRVDLRDPDAIQGQYGELLEQVRDGALDKAQFEQWIVILRDARALNIEREGLSAPGAAKGGSGKVLQMVPKTSKPPFGIKL